MLLMITRRLGTFLKSNCMLGRSSELQRIQRCSSLRDKLEKLDLLFQNTVITAAYCCRGRLVSSIWVVAGEHNLNVCEGSEGVGDARSLWIRQR